MLGTMGTYTASSDSSTSRDGEDILNREQEGLVEVTLGRGDPGAVPSLPSSGYDRRRRSAAAASGKIGRKDRPGLYLDGESFS